MDLIPFIVSMLIANIKRHVLCKSHCIGTCYSGQLLPDTHDIYRGKYLKGYSYKNITTDDPAKCYHHCVQDCRCKACQMFDSRCELLDEDKTSKADNFMDTDREYTYIDVKQTMYHGKSQMVPPGGCYNGCCRSHPCMNGGTCSEQCKNPKLKFICKCPSIFTGTVCQNQLSIETCKDVLDFNSTVIPADRVYTATLMNKSTVSIYCAFNGSKQAWTLIESFSKANLKDFSGKSFYDDVPINEGRPPNWEYYRMSEGAMEELSAKSSMWRATCNFEKRSVQSVPLTPDYLLGYRSDYDIIQGSRTSSAGACYRVAHVNIRGHDYRNVKMAFYHTWAHHFHLDSSKALCDFQHGNGFPDAVNSEDNFGEYGNINTNFKCTESPQSTTQWWLGQEEYNQNT